MRRPDLGGTFGWGSILCVVAAVLVGLSYVANVNRYVAMFGSEMAGAYDCDGPSSVGIFLAPALLLSIVGTAITARLVRRRRTLMTVGAFLLGVFVLVAAVVRLPSVLIEHRKNMETGSPCR